MSNDDLDSNKNNNIIRIITLVKFKTLLLPLSSLCHLDRKSTGSIGKIIKYVKKIYATLKKL